MGILRLFLALCVIHAHTGTLIPWPSPSGMQAVQFFFLISGFYMSLISGGRYGDISDFYKSRALRIYAPYYFHLVAIIGISIGSGLFVGNWLALSAFTHDPIDNNGFAGILVASLANMTIFGMDWLMFFDSPPGSPLSFIWNFQDGAQPLYNYFVIPQCWSVGLELTFYSIVPLLAVWRTRTLASILFISLFVRFFVYWRFDLHSDPWNYRFFPFEIAFFLAGMIAERIYAASPLAKKHNWHPRIYQLLFVALVIVFCGYLLNRMTWKLAEHTGPHISSVVIILCAAPFLGILFFITKNSKTDRWIGELSFPVYLNHLIIIVALQAWYPKFAATVWMGITVAVLSLFFAGLTNTLFFSKFDHWRHLLFKVKPIT